MLLPPPSQPRRPGPVLLHRPWWDWLSAVCGAASPRPAARGLSNCDLTLFRLAFITKVRRLGCCLQSAARSLSPSNAQEKAS